LLIIGILTFLIIDKVFSITTLNFSSPIAHVRVPLHMVCTLISTSVVDSIRFDSVSSLTSYFLIFCCVFFSFFYFLIYLIKLWLGFQRQEISSYLLAITFVNISLGILKSRILYIFYVLWWWNFVIGLHHHGYNIIFFDYEKKSSIYFMFKVKVPDVSI